ncbi:MAG: alpha/beta hydrolase [Acidobacteriota bacterium]|nr:alpha/beta hydrolase [Acidobacteriota bacterium]
MPPGVRHLRLVLTVVTVSIGGSGACLERGDHDSSTSSLRLAPCSVAGIERTTECGTLSVPENRERPGRAITLRMTVVRATQPAAREAVFFLTGGPGTAATASARGLTREHAALAATHDFVFVDQRGTGESNPLRCESPPDPGLPPMFSADDAAICRQALEPTADLLAYTTADAAADLEAVRRALNYGPINLHGSSYGTRLAWAYAAKFPKQARTLVLHGPAPPGFLIPLPFAPGLDVALDGVVADCLADTDCADRFPRLQADVEAAFERLRNSAARVTLDGQQETTLSRGELSEAVRYLLYSAFDARRIPLLLTQAAAGDYTPIARWSANYRRALARDLNEGMYLSVTCAEDIPFLQEPEIESITRHTKLGDYRARQQMAACSAWPRGKSGVAEPRPLPTPALILVGAYDPATPVEAAKRAAALLLDSRVVVVPHGGHALNGLGIDDCLSRMTTRFIAEGKPAAVDDSCVAQARRLPFILQ